MQYKFGSKWFEERMRNGIAIIIKQQDFWWQNEEHGSLNKGRRLVEFYNLKPTAKIQIKAN